MIDGLSLKPSANGLYGITYWAQDSAVGRGFTVFKYVGEDENELLYFSRWKGQGMVVKTRTEIANDGFFRPLLWDHKKVQKAIDEVEGAENE